nr:restriction endonuclease [Actinomycetota bacterium]
MNRLYYGDNLDVLRRYVPDESVDLVYLDPPFKSNQDYNVLFAEQSGERAAAQITAFEDTWRWDQAAAAAFQEVVQAGGRPSEALSAFMVFLGTSDMMAYLCMMAPRLKELRRVLKPTGSIYLHCDPTASHYLKMLMDAVFGPQNFRNEIVWKRTGAHGRAKRWGPVHDTLLFYSISDRYLWNRVFEDYDQSYIDNFYRFEDEHGRYRLVTLDGPGTRQGSSGQPWRDVDPTEVGRHWEVPPDRALPSWFEHPPEYSQMSVQQRLDILDEAGLIYWPTRGGKKPQHKRYLDAAAGNPVQDIISDIRPISSQAAERLGYPTQKPLALLARIIASSTNEGDTVLDPFCGCGTSVDAAQRLNRPWIGIDITHLAVNLIRHRLRDTYGAEIEQTYQVIGEPTSVEDAMQLASEDPYQFQWWALGLVGARPVEQKKGADKGIDGKLYFLDEAAGGKTKQVVISVKAGHTGRNHVHELRGVIDREQAEIGALISMQEPTRPMREEAASAGFYHSDGWNRDYPRLQLLTVSELLGGKTIEYPPGEKTTFKQAERAKSKDQTPELPL